MGETYAAAGVSIEATTRPYAGWLRWPAHVPAGGAGRHRFVRLTRRRPVRVPGAGAGLDRRRRHEAARRRGHWPLRHHRHRPVAMCGRRRRPGADLLVPRLHATAVEPAVVEPLWPAWPTAAVRPGARWSAAMAEHGDGHPLELAGFAVGVVERGDPRRPRRPAGRCRARAALPGLRSNGYSLARRVLLGDELAGWTTRRGPARRAPWPTSSAAVRRTPRRWPCWGGVPVRASRTSRAGPARYLVRALPEGAAPSSSGALARALRLRRSNGGDVTDDEMARSTRPGMLALVPSEAVGAAQTPRPAAVRRGSRVAGERTVTLA